MKKILKSLLTILLIFPMFVGARVDYEDAVAFTNNYIHGFDSYRDYIFLNDKLEYVYENGAFSYNSDFKSGGLLSKSEYEISNILGNTYLANGLEYWTLTQSSNSRHYIINYKLEEMLDSNLSGVRVTEYVKNNTIVNGKGSYGDPWVFADVMSIHINSSNTYRGEVSTVDCSNEEMQKESISLSFVSGSSTEFYSCAKAGFRYLKSTCDKYITNISGTKRYKVENVDKDDLICNITYTYTSNKITLDSCTGCTDPSPSVVYVNSIHKKWFSDENALNEIDGLTTVPKKTGYTFNGYKNGDTTVINDDGTFLTTDLTSDMTLSPSFTPNTYQITLTATNATSTNHTTVESAVYDADLPVIVVPTREYKITYNGNSGTVSRDSDIVGYTFGGYYIGSTQYYNGSGVGVRKWNVASNSTLTAKWTGGAATLPTPTKTGYTFDGWYTSSGEKIENGYKPTADITLIASWSPRSDITYKVNHYRQNVSDSGYTLYQTQNLTGVADSTVTPSVKSYAGFTAPSTQTVTILADGSRVVSYYYTRNSYTVSVAKSTGITSVSGSGTFKYGASVTVNAVLNTGYSFDSWTGTSSSSSSSYTFTMPAGNVTLTAKGSANTVAYKVRHYKANLYDGTYTLAETQSLTAKTDSSVTPSVKTYTGFYSPSTQTATVLGDGSLVVDYYYTRIKYTLTTSFSTGITAASGTGSGWYGETITVTATVASGYTWSKWTGTYTSTSKTYTFTMPASNVTLTATTTANTDTAYKVRHYLQNIDDTNYTLDSTQNLTGTTGASVTPSVNSYTGFTSPSTKSATISGDGTTTIDYYYTRNSYTLTVNKGTGIASVSGGGTYKYDKSVTVGYTLSTGYHFSSWSGYTSAASFTMPAKDATMTANGVANTYYVAYNCNGGTGTMSNSTHTYGTAKALTAEGCTKTNYNFASWNTKADGSGTSYSDKASVNNLTATHNGTVTLYAQWTPATATYYVYHYQQNLANNNYTLVATDTLSGTIGAVVTPSRKSYTGFVTPSAQNLTISSGASITYYYARNTYSVSVANSNCGSVSGGGTYKHGATAVISATPAAGYNFSYWGGSHYATTSSQSLTVNGAISVTAYCIERSTSSSTVAKSYYKAANGGVGSSWKGWQTGYTHNSGSDYGSLQTYVQRFTAPSFSGTSKRITFQMWGVRPSSGTYPTTVTLRYAITKESSMDLYLNTTGTVSDSNAIASGIATYTNVNSPSGSANYINVAVDTTGLVSGGSYVLILWPSTSDNGLVVWQVGYHGGITLEYYN